MKSPSFPLVQYMESVRVIMGFVYWVLRGPHLHVQFFAAELLRRRAQHQAAFVLPTEAYPAVMTSRERMRKVK